MRDKLDDATNNPRTQMRMLYAQELEARDKELREIILRLAEQEALVYSYEQRLGAFFLMREALKSIAKESSDQWSIDVAKSALALDEYNEDDTEGE